MNLLSMARTCEPDGVRDEDGDPDIGCGPSVLSTCDVPVIHGVIMAVVEERRIDSRLTTGSPVPA
jgi:hypothetical protein